MAHSSVFRQEMAWKHIEIGGSWDSARTASTEVERTRSVMALAASICTLSSLLVEVADSQGAQAAAAYSIMPSTAAMLM